MTPSDILAHPDLRAVIRQQAERFLQVHEASPKLVAAFGTHQRYLMGQLFLALAFRSPDGGVLLADFLREVGRFQLASPNTADAFVKGMLREGAGVQSMDGNDRRRRPIFLADQIYELILHWLLIHLATLDQLDGGTRVSFLRQAPALLSRAQPLIVDAILQSRTWMDQPATFSLFTWLNDGGLIMDRLIANLPDFPAGAERVVTPFSNYAELQRMLRISRSHMQRKLAAAESMGSMGWEGPRNRSTLWISRAFVAEYDAYQAEKLAIVAQCFATALQAA